MEKLTNFIPSKTIKDGYCELLSSFRDGIINESSFEANTLEALTDFFGKMNRLSINKSDLSKKEDKVFKFRMQEEFGPKKKENDPLIREETYRPDLHNEYKFNVPKNDLYLCSSHPHQIYFDFLAEHGFIGSIIILSIFFKLTFDLLRKISISRNKLQFACFIYILIIFIPILPSGAFFSDYLLTLFFINFSLLFCVNKNSNLFYKNN